MTAPADLLVAGGGVLGTMTAVLAKLDHPEWVVRLAERGRVGQGATGASAGLSFPLARSPWQASLVDASEAGYARLLAVIPGLPVHGIDVLWVLPEQRVPELAGRLVGGAPVPASEDQCARFRTAYPDFLLKPGEVVMTTERRCFYTYPPQLVEALAAWLRTADPASVWEGTEVVGIGDRDGEWEARFGDGGSLSARRAVTALGPWRSEALAPRLRVKKVAAVHLAHNPPPGAPCVVLWEDDAFVLPLAERGHCLFSYRNTTWDVDPDRRIALTGEDVGAALAVLGPRSAALSAGYAGGRAFCDGYTGDLVPLLEGGAGRAEIGGCSGSGVRLAPGLAAAALAAVG